MYFGLIRFDLGLIGVIGSLANLVRGGLGDFVPCVALFGWVSVGLYQQVPTVEFTVSLNELNQFHQREVSHAILGFHLL